MPQWHQALGSSAFLPSLSLLLLISFHLLQGHTIAATLLEVTHGSWDCCFLSTFILRMKLPKESPKTCLIPHHWLQISQGPLSHTIFRWHQEWGPHTCLGISRSHSPRREVFRHDLQKTGYSIVWYRVGHGNGLGIFRSKFWWYLSEYTA